MLILDLATRRIQLLLGGAGVIPFVSSWVDINQTLGTLVEEGSTPGETNGATPVDMVPAPAAGIRRQVKHFWVRNSGGGGVTAIVRYDDNGTGRDVVWSLSAGDVLQYTDGHGYSVLEVTGKLKVQVGTGGGSGGGVTSPLIAKGDLWGFSTIDDRVPAGIDGQVLVSDSLQATGLGWADAPPGTEGPMGPEGPAGPAGADGADGATGATGPAGPEGPMGPEGPEGPAGSGVVSPLTTKGDIWGYGTTDARVGVGSSGQVLTADPAQPQGVKWTTPAAGGGGGSGGTVVAARNVRRVALFF